jgi:uncharacterized protein (UPF0147 family)
MENLTPQDTAAIAALLTSRTIEQAADQAGIGERTLRRWLSERDDFRQELRRQQRAAMAVVTARLQRAAEAALSTLEDIMGDTNAPPASRVTAARTILELAQERIDVDDLAEQFEELKRNGGYQ